jgi:uncharacterized repeat protein (TIGR04138 family)
VTGDDSAERIEQLCGRDPRFRPEAYYFVIAALESEMLRLGERRHLTGQELALAIRRLALLNYGLMARNVLEAWGCRKTDDFGTIVYNLIDAGLFTRTDEDSIDDFHDVYDFQEAFDAGYEPNADEHEGH